VSTHYPPGTDGERVMRETAEAFQTFIRDNGLGDEVATAVDLDMIELRISGMAARHMMQAYGYWPHGWPSDQRKA
jgi:hypothetical protein